MPNEKHTPTPVDASNNVVKLALEGMKDAPWEARIILAIQAISFILIIAAIGTAIFTEPEYGLICIILGMILSFSVIRRLLTILERVSPSINWSREYIDNNKADNEFQEIGKELVKLTDHVSERISSIIGENYPRENIRANIFLPDCKDARDGYIFRLYIPTPLRCNMNRQQEWGIRFRPGQGSSGICFNEGTTRITLTRDFMIDDEFRDRIHPALKWIISIPLMKANNYALAVLNIDGIEREISKDNLNKIAIICEKEAKIIGKRLNKLPMTKLLMESVRA